MQNLPKPWRRASCAARRFSVNRAGALSPHCGGFVRGLQVSGVALQQLYRAPAGDEHAVATGSVSRRAAAAPGAACAAWRLCWPRRTRCPAPLLERGHRPQFTVLGCGARRKIFGGAPVLTVTCTFSLVVVVEARLACEQRKFHQRFQPLGRCRTLCGGTREGQRSRYNNVRRGAWPVDKWPIVPLLSTALCLDRPTGLRHRLR